MLNVIILKLEEMIERMILNEIHKLIEQSTEQTTESTTTELIAYDLRLDKWEYEVYTRMRLQGLNVTIDDVRKLFDGTTNAPSTKIKTLGHLAAMIRLPVPEDKLDLVDSEGVTVAEYQEFFEQYQFFL